MKSIPNGSQSWAETFYEVVSFLSYNLDRRDSYEHGPDGKLPLSMRIKEYRRSLGHADFVAVSMQLADEFELKNDGREWDGEFYNEIHEFLQDKLNNAL